MPSNTIIFYSLVSHVTIIRLIKIKSRNRRLENTYITMLIFLIYLTISLTRHINVSFLLLFENFFFIIVAEFHRLKKSLFFPKFHLVKNHMGQIASALYASLYFTVVFLLNPWLSNYRNSTTREKKHYHRVISISRHGFP